MAVFFPRKQFRSFSDWLASPAVVAKAFPPPPAGTPVAWSRCERILVLKLDEIGDFVLATPFLRELRRNAPRAHLTLVVSPAVLNLAETCPHVDRVLPYDGQTRGLRAWQFRRQWRALRLARRELRRPRADVAVIPRWGEDAYNATHLAAYARPRGLVAYSETATAEKRAMNRGYDRLVSHLAAPSGDGHEVMRNLALIGQFGGRVENTALELWPDDADRAFARAALPAGPRYVALAPGALDPLRRWPGERFAALAAWLRDAQGLSPVILGTPADPAFVGALDLRGRTTLRQAAALLARCALFVGNDSGPKHLAAAAKIPVVELNGFRPGGDPNHGNAPARFHAWGTPSRLLQPPAGPGVLAIGEIPLAAAQAACLELLSPS